MDGTMLRKRLGLRSTWFTVGVLSLSAPSTPVVYGSRVRLNGIARGVGQAMLQQLQGSAWTAVGTVKAGDAGTLSFVVKPTVTTRYRLTSGKVVAASVRVPVAPLARSRKPKTRSCCAFEITGPISISSPSAGSPTFSDSTAGTSSSSSRS